MRNIFKIITNDKYRLIFIILNIKITIPKKFLSTKFYKNENKMYETNILGCKKPNVINKDETLDYLIKTKYSIARYGDGEFTIINGGSLGFQEYDENLSKKLKTILKSNKKNLLIAIPNVFSELNEYDYNNQKYWRKYLYYNRMIIYKLLDFTNQYYDAFISRPYFIYKNKSVCDEYFNKCKMIWNNQNIVIVEGRFSRLGYNNNLFENAKSIKRILCPEINAYKMYNRILEECIKISKNSLFIIALGPTATILAYDLSNYGYRALDFGHIDIEYEWFKRKAKRKIAIKDKYVNENSKGHIISNKGSEDFNKEILCDLTKNERG